MFGLRSNLHTEKSDLKPQAVTLIDGVSGLVIQVVKTQYEKNMQMTTGTPERPWQPPPTLAIDHVLPCGAACGMCLRMSAMASKPTGYGLHLTAMAST